MPCYAMHPIQDLFLEGFSYVLQIDMHFICTPMWTTFYSCKKWVLHRPMASARSEVNNKIDEDANQLPRKSGENTKP
jgi:hypothetical protein